MTTDLWNNLQQSVSWSGCLSFWFGRTYPKNSSLIFDVQFFRKIDGVVFLNFLFCSHRFTRWSWTVFSKYIRSWYHLLFNNLILLLLIVSFPEVLYNFLIFPIHLCSYKALLLNDWSNPMMIICYFSCSDWNNPLIITHWLSNYPISIIK